MESLRRAVSAPTTSHQPCSTRVTARRVLSCAPILLRSIPAFHS